MKPVLQNVPDGQAVTTDHRLSLVSKLTCRRAQQINKTANVFRPFNLDSTLFRNDQPQFQEWKSPVESARKPAISQFETV
jgi:hypothetical protein